MNGKIVQALNMLNSQENGLSKSYANSEEFVRALSKYMKIDKDVLSFGRATVGVNYASNEIPGVGTVVNIGQVPQPNAKQIL